MSKGSLSKPLLWEMHNPPSTPLTQPGTLPQDTGRAEPELCRLDLLSRDSPSMLRHESRTETTQEDHVRPSGRAGVTSGPHGRTKQRVTAFAQNQCK